MRTKEADKFRFVVLKIRFCLELSKQDMGKVTFQPRDLPHKNGLQMAPKAEPAGKVRHLKVDLPQQRKEMHADCCRRNKENTRPEAP